MRLGHSIDISVVFHSHDGQGGIFKEAMAGLSILEEQISFPSCQLLPQLPPPPLLPLYYYPNMVNKPGTLTYHDGIAILQLIIFPFIAAAALFIWNRTGWRVGSKIWRYPFTFSLIRIAGSISSLLTINHDSKNVVIAMVVCALIGLAPLLLSYVGILKQM